MKSNYSFFKYIIWNKSRFWSLFLLSGTLIFNSCVSYEESVSPKVVEMPLIVQEAKAWFGEQEEFAIQNDYTKLSRGKSITKKIHWDQAITYNDGKTVEVAVEYNLHWVPVKRGMQSAEDVREKQKLSFFRLILDKKLDGDYQTYLLKYFPEQEIENQKNVEVNNYHTLSNKFTGDIWQYSWEEEFQKGWKIENGKIIKTFYAKKD